MWLSISVLLVTGYFFLGEFMGRICADMHEYEVMKSRGYKLMNDDRARD